MIRHCDGTDPNLITWSAETLTRESASVRVPCACGLTFDDVSREVVYPHKVIGPKPTIAEVEQMAAFLADTPGPTIIRHDRVARPTCDQETTVTDVGVVIVHICVRFAEHCDHSYSQHICQCNFTWGIGS